MAAIDLTGNVFGFLSVVGRAQNAADGSARWHCVCVCGNERTVHGTGLRAGRHKSCGCKSPRFQAKQFETHGMSRTRVYQIWQGMLARCSESAKGKSKRLYYDKGIRVCDRWLKFENFLSDMGLPESRSSIDRIDGCSGYSPENCRWANSKEQANNTSSNLLITAHGKTLTASQWADVTGIKANTIVYRIRRGWSAERAISQSPGNVRTKKKLDRKRLCEVCGSSFIPRTTQIRAGGGRYCSQKCNASSRR
jgi:hypothetical protein